MNTLNTSPTCSSGCCPPIRSVMPTEVTTELKDKTTKLSKRILDDLHIEKLTDYNGKTCVGVSICLLGMVASTAFTGGLTVLLYGGSLVIGVAPALNSRKIMSDSTIETRINFLVDEYMKRELNASDNKIVTYVVNQWHLFDPQRCPKHT